ncbi:MAG: DUF885 domain-containing protein [Betaproteobacteria bacterium]
MPQASDALKSLCDRYWAFLRQEFPFNALMAGDPPEGATLFRESPADYDRRAIQAAELLSEAKAIDAHALAREEINTLQLLERELHDVCEAHRTLSHLRPWLLPVGPEFNTIYFAQTSAISSAQDAELYAARLAELPRYFSDIHACLQMGHDRGLRHPRVVLEAAIANLRRNAAAPHDQLPWMMPLDRASGVPSAGLSTLKESALDSIVQGILPAIRALADFMEQTLLATARESVACQDNPLGVEYYAFWTRHFTTIELTPEQIHELGLSEVARVESEIAGVARDAGFGSDVAAYRQHLRTSPDFHLASAESLRQHVEALAKRIDGLIPRIVGHVPRITYGVQSIPAGASLKLPVAYAQPNPADRSSPGTFWVNGLPDRVPTYGLPSITLHEAWPGHLMHIALMQEMDRLPMFRRANFTKYTACLEGWAMYCEWLGIELGLYGTPHEHFGRLDMEMWRACRLVVDTGIHLKGWSRSQAIEYMVERLTLSPDAVEAEVDRYIAMPAQALGYLVGGLKFRELRDRAQQRLGSRFRMREFHDHLMATGAVTLPLLEESVNDWLSAHAA